MLSAGVSQKTSRVSLHDFQFDIGRKTLCSWQATSLVSGIDPSAWVDGHPTENLQMTSDDIGRRLESPKTQA